VAAPVVLLIVLTSLVVNTAQPLTNTDTYFHLRFGQEFLDGWSLRHPGSVSTFATRSWVPTQWLSEIAMARTEQVFGLAGLAWLSGLMEIGLFAALYLAARDRANPFVAISLTGLALFAMQTGLSLRPQVLSYLLVAVVTSAWLRTRHDGRVRWWLVAVTWLWGMLHGMWPVALVIGFVAVAGLALDRAPLRLVLRALAVPLVSGVAAALTPVGPALYTAVLAVGSRSSFFVEWDPPDYTTVSTLTLGLLLALTAAAMWRRAHNPWTEVLLVALAGGFAVYSLRTVPVAAAMVVPLAAGPVQDLFTRRTPVGRRERVVVTGGAVLALAVLAVVVPHTADDPPTEPAWLDPALSGLPAGTKVLDDWSWGGYYMWRYPQLDLLMHGYGDTFTTDELTRNNGMLALDPGWDSALRSTGARIAVIRTYSRLAYALTEQEHWRVVHSSSTAVMLRAPSSWVTFSSPVAGGFGPDGPDGSDG
jgi:RsiW-degrading membrane proteinase PrsW (M82 family)